jgi:Protein of unknown function (DUF1569)
MNTTALADTRSIDTSKVAARRILRFESLDQIMAEVDRLVAAERTGRLKREGNWTLGQILGHIAVWAEFSYTDMPLNPPFFVRWLLRWQKGKYLYGPMPAGVKIPRVNGGTLGTDPTTLDDGLARLQRVIARLRVEPPTAPSKVFGLLTHEEAIALNLRHAELHLGFLIPE